MDAGEVKVRLTADASSLTTGLNKAQDAMQAMNAKAVFMGIVYAEATQKALELAKSLLTVTQEVAKAADIIRNMSAQTGIAAETLESWSLMARNSNLDMHALVVGMRTLSTTMQDATGSTSNTTFALRDLGIKAREPEAVMRAVAERFKSMPDGIEKSRFAIEIFGRAGLQMIPTLNEGAAGIDRMAARTRELGAVLNKTQADSLDRFKKASDENATAMEGFQKKLAAAFAPSTTDAMRMATDMFQRMGDWILKVGLGVELLEIKMASWIAKVQIYWQNIFSKGLFTLETWDQVSARIKDQIDAIDQWAVKQSAAANQSAQFAETVRTTESGIASAATKTTTALFGRAKAAGEMLANQLEDGTKVLQYEQEYRKAVEGGNWALAESIKLLAEEAAMLSSVRGQPGPASGTLQEQKGQAGVTEVTSELARQAQARREVIQTLQAQFTVEEAVERQQAEMYQNEKGLIGAADAARQVSFQHLTQQHDLARAQLLNQWEMEPLQRQQINAQLEALDIDYETKRMQIVRQFPTFWEQQLQAVVDSNAFSMSTIVNQFSGAMASWVTQGTKFKQFWISLQTTLVQAVINLGIQEVAQYGLMLLKKLGLETAATSKLLTQHTALETAKTTITTEEEAARATVTIAQAKLSGGAAVAVMTGLAEASIGVLEGIVVAIAGVFEAMAAALAASIVGAEFAPGMAAAGEAAFSAGSGAVDIAGGLINESLATAVGAVALAKGGVVNVPTLALIGERGREAVVPLDGPGGFGNQTIILMQDGRETTRTVLRHMPREVRLRLGNAF